MPINKPKPDHHHRANGAKVHYDAQGVHLSTCWGWGKLSIRWEEVDFLSIVPDYNTPVEDLDFLQVNFVFEDRRPILKRSNFWTTLWLHGRANFRPLVELDDKWSKTKGRLEIEVDLKSFKKPLPDIVDIWKNNTRFGTLVDF